MRKKFKSCTGIQKWHIIKIQSEGDNILVAEYLGSPFKPYQIMNQTILDENVEVISPEPIDEKRLTELKFFEKYVLEKHKQIISSNY